MLIKNLIITILFFVSLQTGACVKQQASKNTSNQNVNEKSASKQSEIIDEDKKPLKINDLSFSVEYAKTAEERQLGLMFRRELCDNCGMLFKFDSNRIGSIWMKNTYIPLDLAYIDEKGKIIDIFALQPLDLKPVRSSRLILYALEMNQGWFAQQGIKVGDKVELLP